MKNNPANNGSNNVSAEFVFPGGGYAQNTEPDSIVAVSSPKTQACTGNKFGTVGGAV